MFLFFQQVNMGGPILMVVGIVVIVVLVFVVLMSLGGGHSEQGTVEALMNLRDRPYDQSGLKSARERMRLNSNVKTAQSRVALADLKLSLQHKINEATTLTEQEKYLTANVEMDQQERAARHLTYIESETTEQEFQREARRHGYNGHLYHDVILLREAANVELGKARIMKEIYREDYRERLAIDQDNVTRAQLEPYEHRKEKLRLLGEYREELEDETDSARRTTLKREIRRLEDELDEDGPVQAAPEQKKRRSLPTQKRRGGSRAEDEGDEEQVPPQKPRSGGKRGTGKRGGEGESRPLTW
jgi:hypothetical protein